MAPGFRAPPSGRRFEARERGFPGGNALLVAAFVYALLAVTALAVLAAVPESALAAGPSVGFEGILGRVRAAMEMGAPLLERPALLAGVWLGTALAVAALGFVTRGRPR